MFFNASQVTSTNKFLKFFFLWKSPTSLREVETKKTLPDGSTAKISERTVRRNRFGDLVDVADRETHRAPREQQFLVIGSDMGSVSVRRMVGN